MKFFTGWFGRGCSHRFTWPRMDSHGRHYQICPLCGIAYEYDWSTMRRTDRLLTADTEYRPFGDVRGSTEAYPEAGLRIQHQSRPEAANDPTSTRSTNLLK
jgi:hypothetical protein